MSRRGRDTLSHHSCAAMRLDQIRSCIVAAISVGVPVYNQGDPQGCYDVYAKAAHSADTYVPGPPYCTRTGYAWAPVQRSVSARGTGQLVRHRTYAAHVPASGVPCVPHTHTVSCTTGALAADAPACDHDLPGGRPAEPALHAGQPAQAAARPAPARARRGARVHHARGRHAQPVETSG